MEFLTHFTLYGTEALHPKVLSTSSPEQMRIKMPSHGDWHCSRTFISKSVVCNFPRRTRLQILLISN